MGKQKNVGFTQEQMSTAMGFLEDNNVKFTECRFEIFDYAGKKPPAPCFASKVIDLDDDSEHDQRWSVGGTPEDWEVGDDGEILIPISKKAKKGVNVVSNFGMLIMSLINNGYDNEKLATGRASVIFEDLEAHVITVEGSMDLDDGKGGTRKNQAIVIDKLLGKDAPKTPKKSAKGKEKAKEEEEEASGPEAEVQKFVIKLLQKAGGEMAKKGIPNKIYNEYDGPEEKNEMNEFLFDESWMSDAKRPWTLENGVLTLKE